MSTRLAQPILVNQEHIAATQEMWQSLSGWQHTDAALRLAKTHFDDDSDLDTVLLKAVLLDKLYATNVTYHLDLIEVAAKIVKVWGSEGSSRQKVMKLAKVSVRNKDRYLTSFASKYVHFFYDDSVPVYDWYAALALARHYSFPQNRIEEWRKEYEDYGAKIDTLRQKSRIYADAREMDHYLWLAGNWVWLQKRREKAGINKELRAFFDNPVKGQLAEATFGGLLK